MDKIKYLKHVDYLDSLVNDLVAQNVGGPGDNYILEQNCAIILDNYNYHEIQRAFIKQLKTDNKQNLFIELCNYGPFEIGVNKLKNKLTI